jgi:hypothetical protein
MNVSRSLVARKGQQLAQAEHGYLVVVKMGLVAVFPAVYLMECFTRETEDKKTSALRKNAPKDCLRVTTSLALLRLMPVQPLHAQMPEMDFTIWQLVMVGSLVME